MDPTIRLRIATRIHFALLRQYDENVAVGTLLGSEGEAREALWVCEASGNDELMTLAKQFRSTTPAEIVSAPITEVAPRAVPKIASRSPARGTTPQDLAWTQDSSGFGLTRPPEASEQRMAKAAGWLIPTRWLRPASAR